MTENPSLSRRSRPALAITTAKYGSTMAAPMSTQRHGGGDSTAPMKHTERMLIATTYRIVRLRWSSESDVPASVIRCTPSAPTAVTAVTSGSGADTCSP